MRTIKLILLLLSLVFSFLANAQSSLSSEAQAALAKGGQAAAVALATYDEHFIDKPLWRDAVNYGLEAKRLAPDNPQPYRFLGQVYSNINFYSRAWDAWLTFQRLGGEMNAQTKPYLMEVSSWLGNKSFREGDFENALTYYTQLFKLEPGSEEANQHIALSHIELGNPKEAEAYLETLTAAHPSQAYYVNLLSRTQEQIKYGVEATDAYREGIAEYASGNKEAALEAFRRSASANDNYSAPFEWAGRISTELGQLEPAVGYWQRVVQLEPDNTEAQAALEIAEGQLEWGKEAYNVFKQGLEFYQEDRFGEALWSFQQATKLNTRFDEAWAWLGQLSVEARDFQNAVNYYDRAQQLQPGSRLYADALSESSRLLSEQQALLVPPIPILPSVTVSVLSPGATNINEQASTSSEPSGSITTSQTPGPLPTASVETASPSPATSETTSTIIPVPPAISSATPSTAVPSPNASVDVTARQPISAIPSPTTTAPPPASSPAVSTNIEQPTITSPQTPSPTIVASVAKPETPVLTPTPAPSVAVAAPQPVPVPPVPDPQVAPGGPAVTLLATEHLHESPEGGGSGAFSFFNIPSSLVSNLNEPIDYANGTVYQQIQITFKPSGEPVKYELCLVHNDDLSIGPACTVANSLSFEEPGVYEISTKLSSFSNYDQIDWSKGLQQIMLIVKDKDGNTVDDRLVFQGSNDSDIFLSDFYPMEVIFRAILVPAGGAFPGW